MLTESGGHDTAVATGSAVISQSVVTTPATETLPIPESAGATPDDINILQPDQTVGMGDIGRYINNEMTTKEVEDVVGALSRGKKYELLTQHF